MRTTSPAPTPERPTWDEPPRFVDTHVHLDMDAFAGDLDAVLERARDAGVVAFVVPSANDGSWEQVVELGARHPDVHPTVAIHPHDASRMTEAAFERIAELAARPDVVGVGETGLDYHYDRSPREDQRRWFARFLALGQEVDKPVVVHVREAMADALELIEGPEGEGVRGVIHCFAGDLPSARRLLERGWHLSFTGMLSFGGAEELRSVARELPVDRLMIETDAPYLAPVPHRGERNEPARLVRVAEVLAELHGLTIEDVARITTANARSLFDLPLDDGFRIAYRIRNSLYLNITNRCTLACTFCGKFTDFTVKGHDLRLRGGEPDVERVMAAIGDPEGVDEVVFCGYGEPTLRLDLLKEVARRLRACGLRIRLNTDGLANLVHGRDVAPELAGLVDSVSVSLNAPDAATYAAICPSKHGEQAYPALLDFVRSARRHLPEVVCSAVGVPDLDVEATRRVAEAELGVPFRFRPYNEIG